MRVRFVSLLFPLLLVLPLSGACNGESEGYPCDPNASNGGNDDCANGLQCTPGLANANGARCCPPDRTQATTPECSLAAAGAADANPAPPESSTGDDTSTGGGDSSTADAPSETGDDGGGGEAAAPGEAGEGGGG